MMNRFARACLALMAVFLPGGYCFAQETYSDLSARPVGKIHFASLTPKNIWELHRRPLEQPLATTAGTLYLPENAVGRIPAMVITPGSGGIMSNQTDRWKPLFLKMGLAVFIVDTLGSRAIGNTVSNQKVLSYAADISDSFRALKLLATDPRIDPQRIGQIGFSRGGAIAIETMLEPLRRATNPNDASKFAAHVAVYPACDETFWDSKNLPFTGAPIMFLIAGKDDAVAGKFCHAYADKLKAVLPKVVYNVYEGAHHDFDAVHPMHTWLPDGVNNLNCPGREIDLSNWSATNLSTTKRYATIEALEKDSGGYCGNKGYTVANNEGAAKRAEMDVRQFISDVFDLK
jgi:dienelactone hydrolase